MFLRHEFDRLASAILSSKLTLFFKLEFDYPVDAKLRLKCNTFKFEFKRAADTKLGSNCNAFILKFDYLASFKIGLICNAFEARI